MPAPGNPPSGGVKFAAPPRLMNKNNTNQIGPSGAFGLESVKEENDDETSSNISGTRGKYAPGGLPKKTNSGGSGLLGKLAGSFSRPSNVSNQTAPSHGNGNGPGDTPIPEISEELKKEFERARKEQQKLVKQFLVQQQ